MSTTTESRAGSKASESNSRGESRASSRESYSRSSRGSPRKSRANKIYRCPPTPEPEFFAEKEKTWVLDNIAMSSVERENNRGNPKVGTIIQPYNSHYDKHPRAYFKFTGVDKVLQKTQQEKGRGDTSTFGPLVDYHWNQGKGARYLQLRNLEFGCGKSWEERSGPGQSISPVKSSFYFGDPDVAFGRHFNSPYSESASRTPSRAGVKSREGASRSSMGSREGSTSSRPSTRANSVASNGPAKAYSDTANNGGKTADNNKKDEKSQNKNSRYKSDGNKY